MSRLITRILSWCAREEGGTMVEYGLMVALIALTCTGVATALGISLSSVFAGVDKSLAGR